MPNYLENTAANLCTCDDFLLEAHYKVYFKQSDAANSYVIESFEADLVYGSLEKKCDEEYMHTFNIKTSVQYLENKDSRKLSGSPGYLRGKPVIIGQVEKVEVATEGGSTSLEDQININLNGFPLRGAKNDGTCYYVDETVTSPTEKLSDILGNFDALVNNYK